MTRILPEVVRAQNGTEYTLETCLGEGGQGTVYRVQNQDRAVKIYRSQRGQRLEETLAYLRRLPLRDMCIATPLVLLASPNLGYVMELMTGMEPLNRYLHPPHDADVLAWYIETGGLVRRLRLLARTAEILAELHQRGMVFVDLSPNNIFVSEDPQRYEVWLIDPDNIRRGVSDKVLYTPGYAPPEFFRPQPFANSLTDAWSFAVLAFETLNLLHPFCGDVVHDGPPEKEEEAFQGKLPFVDDKQDRSNEASVGLPREITLTPSLCALFQETLGQGRGQPHNRSGLARWAQTLARAAEQTLTCPECNGSFYYLNALCPWCDAPRPAYKAARVFLRESQRGARIAVAGNPYERLQIVHQPNSDGQMTPKPIEQVICQQGREATLTARHFGLNRAGTQRDTLRLRWEADRVELQACNGEELWLLRLRSNLTEAELEPLGMGVRSFRDRLLLGVVAEPQRDLHRLLLLL